ncbi:DUF6152 family protein [Candidatus Rariloculus sp.]|uniref:DUF6152 family protein n=1 Tax=Candidatus Rariloculus sp. TaxID=3101265 RepID=UPI003D0B9AEF
MAVKTISTTIAASLMTVAHLASAHHSGSMFDRSKTVTLEGYVLEYQFQNPHTWIEIIVSDEDGNETQWSIEGETRRTMTRIGLGYTKLAPGDEVTIRAHPLRDGRTGGVFIDIRLPDGTTVRAGG